MKKVVFFFLLLTASGYALSQEKRERAGSYSREISSSFDNDIFFFIDYYYTAGMDVTYRRLTDPSGKFHKKFAATSPDTAKVIISYQGGFKIFNPRNIDFPETSTMDRPYAGWTFLKFSVSNFPSANAMNRYEAEAGFVGKDSRIGQLQRWVHHVTGYEIPKGWPSQIRDEAVLNLYYSRYQAMKLRPNMDVVSQSVVKAGTGGNKISEDITLRMLKFNPISNSVFTQSRMSWDTKEQAHKRKVETFLIFGYGIDYVLSDVFIEGSLFENHKSVFTAHAKPFVIRRTYGLMFSSRAISWSATIIHLSKEVPNGEGHLWASLNFAVRF